MMRGCSAISKKLHGLKNLTFYILIEASISPEKQVKMTLKMRTSDYTLLLVLLQ